MSKELSTIEKVNRKIEYIEEHSKENGRLSLYDKCELGLFLDIKNDLKRLAEYDKAYIDIKSLSLEQIIETYKKDIVIESLLRDSKILNAIIDYLNLRIKTEPNEMARKAFEEIRKHVDVLEEAVK